MLRTLLKQAFGADSYSVYNDPFDLGKNAVVSEEVGHQNLPQAREDFIAAAKASDEVHFLKTHEAPPDSSKAIYVVRDGRAAVVSLWHWFNDIKNDPQALENVICGNLDLPSWSEHYEAWAPEKRANTLFLRYEEARDWSPALIARIADFIGIEPKNAVSNDFERMHALAPSFFRKADNEANIAELKGPAADLFWMLHGEAMVKLGYVASAPRPKPAAARRAILQFRDRARELSHTQEQRTLEIERDRQARLEAILAREDELARIKAEYNDIATRYLTAEADRQARLEAILAREDELARVRAEYSDIAKKYLTAEADREARLNTILQRERDLERLRADLEGLSARYLAAEADREARLKVILDRESELARLQTDLSELSEKYWESEADRQARLEVIYDRERSIAALQAEIETLRAGAAK